MDWVTPALVTPEPAPVVYFLKFQLENLMSNQLLPRNVNPSSTERSQRGVATIRGYGPPKTRGIQS